jgi:tape measure domain-containing protein
MASKGTVQMQELKLQLAQAIPGAFEIMAQGHGRQRPEIQ